MTANPFEPCGICGTDDWQSVYSGPVRDGAFGNRRDDAEVARCCGCGVERLAQPADTDAYLKTHDPLQRHTLEALWPTSLRGLTIADIGCAGAAIPYSTARTMPPASGPARSIWQFPCK